MSSNHSHAPAVSSKSVSKENLELIFAILCGVCFIVGWGLSWTNISFYGVILPLFLGAYFFGGFFTLGETWENLKSGQLQIDFLMLVAAAGAGFLGHWAEGAMLLFLFSLSNSLEQYALGRARRAIESLAKLAPKHATVRRGDETIEVGVEELVVGDRVVVRPNERIAADGVVVKGESSVDQSPITGESVPVDKRPVANPESAIASERSLPNEHRVFAGTINQLGALEILVTHKSTDSTLSRVVTMVNEAQAQKSTTQHFAEKFERWFVPLVIGLVVILIFAWVVIDEPFAASFYRAMAVLVGASPCALAISTPSAVLSGVARAARGGVLVKGGGPLEDLGNVRAIAFDKTGTLTQGRPELTDVVPLHDTSKIELLQIAVAVEALSDHPLASAIVRDGSKLLAESPGEPLTPLTTEDNGLAADRDGAENLVSVTGRGVTATVRGATAQIGKDVWFLESDPAGLPAELSEANTKLKESGRTTMIVKWQGRFLGVLGLMDQPRVDAREMLDRLRGMGIERMIMISGDNQKVADAVANAVGLDEAWGDLMPSDKVDAIRRLRDEMSVAMVGDGVNDAPAMANATVGIAMGAAGSDVALETADVALMADNLNHLPFAIGLSRMTNQIIRQNVWFSLGMVLFLIPAAILGLKMGPAVALHEGSTLVVVLNALRLLGFKMPGKIE